MLVLVRLISPIDYGRASAVAGFLGLMNAVSINSLVPHALQIPESQEPDWSLHWSVGCYVQGALFCCCEIIAFLCFLTRGYRPIASLLSVAGFGLLFDLANSLSINMIRRSLDYGRYRFLLGASVAFKIALIIILAVAGQGALGIVLGSNVVSGMPFGVDLLCRRRWRPRAGWWRWPDWKAYRSTLYFGAQQAGSSLLIRGRVAAESAILPLTLGFGAIGLWNRGQALYSISVGRVGAVLIDTAYPVLPRFALDRAKFSLVSGLFLQVASWVAIIGALYVGISGDYLLAVLYGPRWASVEPLVWPGALGGMAAALFSAGWSIALGAGRLKTCFSLDITSAILVAPALGMVFFLHDMRVYAWALVAVQGIAAIVALSRVFPLLQPGALRSAIWPPLCAGASGCAIVLLMNAARVGLHGIVHLSLATSLYAVAALGTLRLFWPDLLHCIVFRLPGASILTRMLSLDSLSAEAAL
jgi:PST family polysaccharide transporter